MMIATILALINLVSAGPRDILNPFNEPLGYDLEAEGWIEKNYTN